MLHKFFFAVLVFLAPLLHAVPSGDVTITDIEVNIPGKDRQKNTFAQAVDLGKREAFDKMLLSFSRQPLTQNISDDEIGDMISRVKVIKATNTHANYRAKLKYYFKRAKVDAFLQGKTKHLDVPHILPKTNLLVPVFYAQEGKAQIWENTPWRQIWLQQIEKLPVIVPLGDFEDMQLLKADVVESPTLEHLDKIMKKYHCTSCTFVSAKLENTPSPEISGQFFVKTLGNVETKTPLILKAPNQEALFHQAVDSLVPEVKKLTGVKEVVTIPQDHMTAVRVFVPFKNPGEYYKFEDRLKKVKAIEHIDTESIAINEAQLNLLCFGGREALGKALKEEGLILQANGNRLSIIEKPVDVAEALPVAGEG